jgi:hypothetical protein
MARKLDLLVAIQGGEKLLNGFGKPFKEPPQAPQPSPHVTDPRPDEVCNALCFLFSMS